MELVSKKPLDCLYVYVFVKEGFIAFQVLTLKCVRKPETIKT